ncbi:MAG: cysteine desulfurase-like protein [Acidobacteria bacterium]|nr:cysteine desulfurase-like protein [Acidobacteriota bacterium]
MIESLTTVAPVEVIRRHFPALERTHNGYAVAYFDGPGGTQVPRAVVAAMNDYLYHHNANTHWAYPTSQETDEIIENARQTVAEFLNAASSEIAFGQNMTSLTYHLGRALGRQFKVGDEIIITELDHHANIDSWRALERERGVTIRQLQLDTASGQLNLQELANLLNEKTRLVAIGAASNALGTINEVKRASQMARQAGALSFTDAVHYAPHQLVDVQEIGCDFLACSAYKFYGPHLGILYGRKELIEAIDFPRLRPAPDYSPERAETGTQSHEAIAGAAAAVDFLASLVAGEARRERLQIVYDEMHARQKELTAQLWEGLSAIKGVKVYGPAPDAARTSTVAFTVKHHPSEAVTKALVKRGVFTSHGDFYALTVVERLGLAAEGLVRAGCTCYTTAEEVERLLAGVRALVSEK